MGTSAIALPETRLRTIPLAMLSDERLAAQAADGDDAAFATLFERYRAPLSRYCRSIVCDGEEAGDAFQNTMLAALRALHREAPSGRVRPWLYAIAHNESVSLIRRRRPNEQLVAETPDTASDASDPGIRERIRTLLADLRELPERQRGALVMRELAGLDYQEIGRVFETSAVAARKAVYEARVSLAALEDGRETDCQEIRRQISEGDGRALRARRVRGHLQVCSSCSSFELGIRLRREVLALIPVLPGLPAIGLLAGSVGGGTAGKAIIGGGAAIGGGATAAGGGTAISIGSGAVAAVKCLTVCGAIAVAGAGVVAAEHAAQPAAPHRAAPLIAMVRRAPAVAVTPPTARAASTAGKSAAGSPALIGSTPSRSVAAPAHTVSIVRGAGASRAAKGTSVFLSTAGTGTAGGTVHARPKHASSPHAGGSSGSGGSGSSTSSASSGPGGSSGSSGGGSSSSSGATAAAPSSTAGAASTTTSNAPTATTSAPPTAVTPTNPYAAYSAYYASRATAAATLAATIARTLATAASTAAASTAAAARTAHGFSLAGLLSFLHHGSGS